MTGAAVLTLIATVLAAEGVSVEVDIGLESGLRPGDRGVVFYVVGEGADLLRYEVAEGEILNASAYRATLAVDPEAPVEPGHLVRFRIPEERLARPTPHDSRANRPPPGSRDRAHTIYVVRDGVFPCLNVRTHAAMESPVVDCLPSGTPCRLDRRDQRVEEGDARRRCRRVDSGPLSPGRSRFGRRASRASTGEPDGARSAAGARRTDARASPDPAGDRPGAGARDGPGGGGGNARPASRPSAADLDESQRDREEQARRLAALEADLSALESRNAELLREREELESGQAEAATTPAGSAAGDSGFQVHLAALEERARQLRDEAFEARTALAAAERQLAETTRSYEAVQLEKETLARQVEDLEIVRSRLEGELVTARTNEATAVERADRLEAELDQATTRISSLANELETNRVDLTAAQTEVERIQGLIEASQGDLDRSEQGRTDLEGSLAGAESEARSLEAVRLELHGLLADEVAAREELESEVTQLRSGLDAARTELEASRAEAAALRSRLDQSADLSADRDELTVELRRITEERDQQVERVGALEQNLVGLGEELAATRTERDELESRMATVAADGGVPPIPMRVSPTMTACLRVRMGPSRQDAVVDCLPGAELLEVERAPEWRRVRSLGHREGWVSEAFLEPGGVEQELTVVLEGGDR